MIAKVNKIQFSLMYGRRPVKVIIFYQKKIFGNEN